jgi:BolA family transcriptional regulator, general stress-responsive regulator
MTADILIAQITEILESEFTPKQLKLTDESALHVGHPGAQPGRFHLALYIRAECFADLTRIKTHRMIYAALDQQIKNYIHALRIDAAGN